MLQKSKHNHKYLFVFVLFIGLLSSCYEDTEGCLDQFSTNYDVTADISCMDCCTYPTTSVDFLHRYHFNRLQENFSYKNDHGLFVIKSFNFFIRDIHLTTTDGLQVYLNDTIDITLNNGTEIKIEDNINFHSINESPDLTFKVDNCNLGEDLLEKQIASIQFNLGLNHLNSQIDTSQLDSLGVLYNAIETMYDVDSDTYNNVRFQYALDTISVSPVYNVEINENIAITLFVNTDTNFILGENTLFNIKINYYQFFSNINFENDDKNTIIQKWIENAPNAFEIIE